MVAASVPFMITRQMRADLAQLGLTGSEIALLSPDEAWQLLGGPPHPRPLARSEQASPQRAAR
jgi:hypothetical protein